MFSVVRLQAILWAIFAVTLLIHPLRPPTAAAQDLSQTTYSIGSPLVTELWVNPLTGSDSNNGRSRAAAFRTLTAAWNTIPQGIALTSTGYRINLTAGDYPESSIPNYLESRRGTALFPIIIQAADGAGTARLRGDLNLFNVSYLYLIDFAISPNPPGDAVHFEQSDHLLLRGMQIDSGAGRSSHETIKINQSQFVYIEDSEISGSYENAIDFVAVQYGHIVRNKIHDADDWCIYLKGGSAYFAVEANEIYNCGTGGFTAGQGTGFEYMVSPWLHYEAYDLKVVNNLIHDTEGAGLGVNGGYNILMAHNTLYRVGARSHTIEVVFGLRTCDGDTSACAANLSAGGWGTLGAGGEQPIGNRNIFILNNLIFNPAGSASAYQHLAVYGPRTAGGGTNIPSPVRTDVNLSIRGNLFWNGGPGMPIGVEDSDQGCQPGNPSCSLTQLQAENGFNSFEPQLADPEGGNFRPLQGGNLFSAPTAALTAFTGGDRVSSPLAPAGILNNAVTRDYSGLGRGGSNPPGAYAGPLRDRAPADGYLGWNGFLRMINILELINTGDSALDVTATLFNINGEAVGQRSVRIEPNTQQDLIVNDIPGFVPDSYGLITLDLSADTLIARMSYYRPAQIGGSFDFAFALPLRSPSNGSAFVSFNTYQPSLDPHDLTRPVYNWLSVINYDSSSAKDFAVLKYDSAGALIGSTSITVAPFGRVDLDGGHLNPGPSRVGLLEIIPSDPLAPYAAYLVRYGDNGSGYSFAFPLVAAPGGAADQFAPVSTGGGAKNWLELTNCSASAATTDLQFNDGAGVEIASGRIEILPHAQIHLDAAAILGRESSGSVRISTSTPGVLQANSMYYFFGPAGQIDAMYGTQSHPASAGPLAGSYNLFLGMANWLKLFNSGGIPAQAVLRVHSAGGVRELNFSLPPRAAIDLPIHQQGLSGALPDTYGVLEVEGGLSAQLLRIKPLGDSSRFDFVFPTSLQ